MSAIRYKVYPSKTLTKISSLLETSAIILAANMINTVPIILSTRLIRSPILGINIVIVDTSISTAPSLPLVLAMERSGNKRHPY